MVRGQYEKAESLFRQVLEVRRRVLGPEHPDNLTTTLNLVQLYQNHGYPSLAEPLVVRIVEILRRRTDYERRQLPFALNLLSRNLLLQNRYAEAEPVARESMMIYQKTLPDNWCRFDSESQLGGSLLGQKKYAEAEPPLLSAYKELKSRESTVPARFKPRVPQAGGRIVQLYDAWGKPEKAAAWKTNLSLANLPADVFARP
jgi:eukaryotic-like serine/threonine-protein kinase